MDAETRSKVITLQLTVGEAYATLSALCALERKRAKEVSKSTFVPEPGRRDVAKAQLATLKMARAKIQRAVDVALP